MPALLLAFILPGCASVDVLRLSSETFTPQTSHVEILERAPTRPYVPIAVLTVDSWWLSLDSKREKILEKAATLGADAVVFGDSPLSSPLPGDRTAGESTPPPSLPPKDIEQFMPDDLHSSMQEGMLTGDVRIFLVRGGGHGGGRGGGPDGGDMGRTGAAIILILTEVIPIPAMDTRIPSRSEPRFTTPTEPSRDPIFAARGGR